MNSLKLRFLSIISGYFLLLTVTIFYSIAAHSSGGNHYLGANMDIQLNDITHLRLPINALKGSQLKTGDSLQIDLKGRGLVTVYTLTKESIGFSVDMRDYPKHIMGLKKTKAENEYANLISTAIQDANVTYQPLKTALFKTNTGDGYLTIGARGSVIYLTDSKADNIVTKIHIESMSEQDISNLIIKGLL